MREMRENAKLSAKELCDRIGWTLSMVSDVERGIRRMPLARAKQLSGVFGNAFVQVIRQILQDSLDEAGLKDLRVRVELLEDPDDNRD